MIGLAHPHSRSVSEHRRSRGGPPALVAMALVAAAIGTAAAVAETRFPFGQELRMDVAPMQGSKKIPSIDIADNGLADIELWCNAVKARLIVVGDTITVLTGPRTERSCAPERSRGDDDVLAALTQATRWHVEDDLLVIDGGPSAVRFRLQTN